MKSKNRSQILIYRYIHEKLQKKFPQKVTTRKEVISYFAMSFHMPKEVSTVILKELNENGLVEMVNRDKLEIVV